MLCALCCVCFAPHPPVQLSHLAPSLVKGEDTMDVWFDSGSSWAGVVRARQDEGLTFPADLYLEGSDQHRGGWVVIQGGGGGGVASGNFYGWTVSPHHMDLVLHIERGGDCEVFKRASGSSWAGVGYYVDILESLRPGS
jgi:hypothetical protein